MWPLYLAAGVVFLDTRLTMVTAAPKKKANKKKKSKAKLNGDSVKQADEQKVEAVEVDDNEAEAEPETPTDVCTAWGIYSLSTMRDTEKARWTDSKG
jgi:hypothetical protein